MTPIFRSKWLHFFFQCWLEMKSCYPATASVAQTFKSSLLPKSTHFLSVKKLKNILRWRLLDSQTLGFSLSSLPSILLSEEEGRDAKMERPTSKCYRYGGLIFPPFSFVYRRRRRRRPLSDGPGDEVSLLFSPRQIIIVTPGWARTSSWNFRSECSGKGGKTHFCKLGMFVCYEIQASASLLLYIYIHFSYIYIYISYLSALFNAKDLLWCNQIIANNYLR